MNYYQHSLLSDNAIYNAKYATMPLVHVLDIFRGEIIIFRANLGLTCKNGIGQRMPIVQLQKVYFCKNDTIVCPYLIYHFQSEHNTLSNTGVSLVLPAGYVTLALYDTVKIYHFHSGPNTLYNNGVTLNFRRLHFWHFSLSLNANSTIYINPRVFITRSSDLHA